MMAKEFFCVTSIVLVMAFLIFICWNSLLFSIVISVIIFAYFVYGGWCFFPDILDKGK
jgi:hypothetical protein